MKLLKYGIAGLGLIAIAGFAYYKFVQSSRLYENWPLVQKHACMYGAYYFSYLFKTELDPVKVNSECTNVAKGPEPIAFFCARGMTFVYDVQILEQSVFMKTGIENPKGTQRTKSTELLKLCREAVRNKFDSNYKDLESKANDLDSLVEPPPKDLFRKFSNLRCDFAKPPCME